MGILVWSSCSEMGQRANFPAGVFINSMWQRIRPYSASHSHQPQALIRSARHSKGSIGKQSYRNYALSFCEIIPRQIFNLVLHISQSRWIVQASLTSFVSVEDMQVRLMRLKTNSMLQGGPCGKRFCWICNIVQMRQTVSGKPMRSLGAFGRHSHDKLRCKKLTVLLISLRLQRDEPLQKSMREPDKN